MKEKVHIVRYKKDLRMADHKPLYEACQQDLPVVALYVWEPKMMQHADYSHFHQYRIQESLKDLSHSLRKINIPLLMWHGGVEEILTLIQKYYEITHIYAHEETGNNLTYLRDIGIMKYCQNNMITYTEYPTNAVVRRLADRDMWDKIWKERIHSEIVPTPSACTLYAIDAGLLEKAKKSFYSFVPAMKPAACGSAQDMP